MKVLCSPSRVPKRAQNDYSDECTYQVERIVSHSIDGDGELYYWVRWKGYPHSDNSRMKERDMVDTEMIHKYLRDLSAKESAKRSKQRDASVNTVRIYLSSDRVFPSEASSSTSSPQPPQQ